MSEGTTPLKKMRPPAPPTLNKETVGVWNGWGGKGDKEVAREAAAKGLHINLAIQFLSIRKGLQLQETHNWFKEEVLTWVSELLERKQIFKATHIIQNIALDPNQELLNVFYAAQTKELREYIGNHLLKVEKLDEHSMNLWTLLNLIQQNVVLLLKYKLENQSIKCVIQQENEWKAEVATILYLKTEDSALIEFLDGPTLWKQLLSNKDIANLQLWITLTYNSNSGTHEGILVELFKKFPVTYEMISGNCNYQNEPLIYNELSKYGIFRREEKDNFLMVLERLKNSNSIGKIADIFALESSVVSMQDFMQLLIEYCLKENHFSILNECVKDFIIRHHSSGELQLIQNCRLLTSNFNETSLRQNIFNVSCHVSKDLDPVIMLSMILLTETADFLEIATKNHFRINETVLDEFIPKIMEEFRILHTVVLHRTRGYPQSEQSPYGLMDKHLKVKSSEMYEFRFKKTPLPHFGLKEIGQKFGYLKQVNYMFFVKQSRPSIATKLFIINQLDSHGFLKEDDLKRMEKKVFKLAINNFNCDEITTSCISVLAMLGRDSTHLRVILKVAKILLDSGYGKSSILEVLFNSDEDPYALQNVLETILIEKIELIRIDSGSEFLEAMKTYDIVVKFSKLSNIKLPEWFLRYCASANLWLPFLIFVQFHNYPLDQVKRLIQFFKSPNMLEHLSQGVINDLQPKEKHALMSDRDSRKSYLSRVGLRKSVDLVSFNSGISHTSDGSSESSEFFDADIINNIKATLLQTFIRCHNSTDPPKALLQACQLYRNPLLAIFATSYEPDSLITNWLTWLGVSCGLSQTYTNYESMASSPTLVTNLLEDCMKNEHPVALLESFEIFIPQNPLKIFLEFLNWCIVFNLHDPRILHKLDQFQTSLKSRRKSTVSNEIDHEMTYLSNRTWIEHTALRLLASALNDNLKSLNDQILIIQFLCDLHIWHHLPEDCPHFNQLLDMLKVLRMANCEGARLDITGFAKNRRQAVIACINALLEKHQYDTALKIAHIEKLPPDLILMRKWQNAANQRTEPDFWYRCDENLMRNGVTADCVVDFYVGFSEKLSDGLEIFIVLKLACKWALQFDLSCQYHLERKMWMAFLHLDEKHRDLNFFSIKNGVYLYKDLLVLLQDIPGCEGSEISKELMAQVEQIVIFALKRGNFWLALRLQKMFDSKSSEMEILKLCHSLAEGILLPHQLNTEQRLLLSNMNYVRKQSSRTSRKHLLSLRLSSVSSASHSPAGSMIHTTDHLDPGINDTLAILKLLLDQLKYSSDIANNIYMMYRISLNIEIPYHAVTATSDYKKLLKDALEDNCMNKLEVVHDFVQVYRWTKEEIADFLCEALIHSMSNQVSLSKDQFTLWDLDLDLNFKVMLQLLQENCSILGYKIYSYCISLHKSRMESTDEEGAITPEDLVLIVELLIRTHDCYTADCNMEGISVILKKSKEIVGNLSYFQDWKLIVRLLTGVGRYTEMTYVFQMLMEHEQFEFLLRKGFRKDNSLKIALLDYLQKHCPDNHDLYKIVALHFTLFSEVAMFWEREAESVIQNLISIAKLEMQNNKMNPETEVFVLFQNTEGTRNFLKKAMENYTHATDFHLQGEKLTKAANSAKQAELIALQLGLLSELHNKSATTVCLFGLKNAQIASLITNKLTFEQSYILVEAYSHYADWASVLYQQYVIGNKAEFLEGFLQHFPLTDNLVREMSRKFINCDLNTANEIRCMKIVVSCLPSLHMKYRIASELGFTDVVEELIASGQMVHLKDTVWKRGYRN